jgi:1,2-diacylglycerol 3-beta-glucosyltransferase
VITMGSIELIIPASPSEPAKVIENSIEHLKELEVPEGLEAEIHYVIDSENIEEDVRFDTLDESSVDIIKREPEDGTRAGAINMVLETVSEPEYIAIFDIDSRPEKNFLIECRKDLEEREENFISSSTRNIINADRNMITKTVDAEFQFFNDVQRLNDATDSFNHFNGPISVIDGEFAVNHRFNEKVICEDTDFTERGYLEGRRASITRKTEVGEQAPTNLGDLYYQKIRWMDGAREGLEYYLKPFLKSENPLRVKFSWFMAMFLPFVSFVFSPLALLYSVRMKARGDTIYNSLLKGVLLFLFTWFITFCGLVALKKRIKGENIGWKSPERENL